MSKKLFDNTIPVTNLTETSGKAITYQLDALQTSYLADKFCTPLGEILKADTTFYIGNYENQMEHYPAYNLEQLNYVLQKSFLEYVLHHVSFKDTPVLAQYAFPDCEEKNYNIFVLGGNTEKMYVIYENYEKDVMKLMQIDKLPHVYRAKMEKVTNSPVKKVSDLWEYHHNAFMGFGIF